jgi:hypothetical protein
MIHAASIPFSPAFHLDVDSALDIDRWLVHRIIWAQRAALLTTPETGGDFNGKQS